MNFPDDNGPTWWPYYLPTSNTDPSTWPPFPITSNGPDPMDESLPLTGEYSQPPGPQPEEKIMMEAAPSKKAPRAVQACDQCRKYTVKCDEGRPSCRHCKESDLTCVYKENPPPKMDGTALILQKLQQMDDRMVELQDEQAKQSQLLKQLLSDREQG